MEDHNEIWDKLTPDIQTDHGKFNLADLAVIVLDIILLGYTCYRSWHFLDGSFAGNGGQTEFAALAIIGLVGLDIGAIAWSLVWMFGSTTLWQDVAALVMFVVDVIGMVLTSMVDSIGGSSAEVPIVLRTAALYGVPAIILLNVIVGVIYHMVSPATQLSRKKRRLTADLRAESELAELRRRYNSLKLDNSQKAYLQRQELIEQQQKLADQKITLDGIELGVRRALNDTEAVQAKSDEVANALVKRTLRPPAPNPAAPAAPAAAPAAQFAQIARGLSDEELESRIANWWTQHDLHQNMTPAEFYEFTELINEQRSRNAVPRPAKVAPNGNGTDPKS